MRGQLLRSTYPSELIEKGTNRRVFIRGVNVPAKLPPFQYGLAGSDLKMLVEHGFTAIRLIVTWESLEPEEGKYNKGHMEYIRETVRLCAAHAISVIIDPHQDCWSKCTGGDGAPEWTLTRLGFNLQNMDACCGSYRAKQNEYQMLWATNYRLFACATMFTLFFGSDRFARTVVVDGVSAQQFLQGHFIKAFGQLAECLKDEKNVMGFGVLNEPSLGWIGHKNIHNTGDNWSFGYSLTPSQCIQLAAGMCIKDVAFYEYPLSWPRKESLNKYNAVLCDSIWPHDMKTDHFALRPDEDAESLFLVPFWEKFTTAMHTSGGNDLLIFTEFPPLEHAGKIIKKYKRSDYEISAPHFYEAVTMAFGGFHWWVAVDFLTGLPGLFCCAPWARYNTIRMITHDSGGVILGETGVPWDHKTNAALEATFNAIEANLVPGVFIWCFKPNHGVDDGWNRENFSIFHDGKLRVQSACRPYAMRVAGKPSRMSLENSVFRLVFESCEAINSTETVIYITSKPYSSIKISDGTIKHQANNTLIFNHIPSLGKVTHWIFIEYI